MEFFGISPLSKSRSKHLLRVMLVVLLLAAFMRIFTFRRFLPYTDYPDELNMYNLALNWRGTDLAKAYGTERIRNLLGGYPPLFVWVDMGVQQILESTLNRWIGAGEVSFWMRLIAVGLGFFTTAMVLDTAGMLGGLLASIIPGLAWA